MMTEMYNPKNAAGNFAHGLCCKKKKHLDVFMGLVVLVGGGVLSCVHGPGFAGSGGQ